MSRMPSDIRALHIAGVLSLLVFVGLAAGVQYKWIGSLGVDRAVADGLHEHAAASPLTRNAFLTITWFGTHYAFLWLSAVVMLAAIAMGRWRFAAVWAVVQIIGGALIQQTKLYFGRSRPEYNGMYATEDSYSFPSGHALASMVAYGLLAYVLVLVLPGRALRWLAILQCAAGIAAIGFSRIYLGVHWFSDVIGGYALGLAWLLFCIALIEEVRRQRAGQISGQ